MEDFRIPLSNAALLEALAEEASELAHAALKLARIYRGENPTPVSKEAGFKNLEEEVADVTLVLKALGLDNSKSIEQIRVRKYNRLKERLWKQQCESQIEPLNPTSKIDMVKVKELWEDWDSSDF